MRSVRDRFESRLLELLGADRVHLNCAPRRGSSSSAPSASANSNGNGCINSNGNGCINGHSASDSANGIDARLPNTSSVSLLLHVDSDSTSDEPSARRATFLGPRIVESGAPDFHVSTGAACHSTSRKCVQSRCQYIFVLFITRLKRQESSVKPARHCHCRPSAVLMECLRGAGRSSELVEELASNAVRVSFGRYSSFEDADRLATGIAQLYHTFLADLRNSSR